MIDHVLLIGFGGPEKPEEVRPFLERLTQGTRIPESRLKEVAHHYELTGGFSPYNGHALRLFRKLREQLKTDGAGLPVFLAMRNWHPFLAEAMREISGKKLRDGLAIVLAPHRSEASFGRYVESVEAACRESGAPAGVRYLPSWHDHPFFIQAQADRIRPLLASCGGAHLLFTAHSIPVEMARVSRYEEEIQTSSRLVAEALGVSDWSVAYQSRSGPPGQPWLEPAVGDAIRLRKASGARALIAVPVGFLFDHTEVLYDLDVEAKQEAEREGLEFLRAPTVMDHPRFVRMLSDLIQEQTVLQGAER